MRFHLAQQIGRAKDLGRKGQLRRGGCVHHWHFERVKQSGSTGGESAEISGGCGAKGARDVFGAVRHVCHQVQRGAIRPEVTGEDVFAVQRDMIFERAARISKKGVEYWFHRQDGWARVHSACIRWHGAHFATRT